MKIKHVFFDLDHTLWDFETNSTKTFEKIFKLHNIDVDLDKFLRISATRVFLISVQFSLNV